MEKRRSRAFGVATTRHSVFRVAGCPSFGSCWKRSRAAGAVSQAGSATPGAERSRSSRRTARDLPADCARRGQPSQTSNPQADATLLRLPNISRNPLDGSTRYRRWSPLSPHPLAASALCLGLVGGSEEVDDCGDPLRIVEGTDQHALKASSREPDDCAAGWLELMAERPRDPALGKLAGGGPDR